MELNSMLRMVVRYFSRGKIRRELRAISPRIESLENREVMTVGVLSTASILTPIDGSVLTTNAPSLIVKYSEDVIGANQSNNYIMLSSSGREIPLANPTYDNTNFQASFSPAQINNGVPLPLDTYSLFVRLDKIIDGDDGVPLSGSNSLVVTSGPRQSVFPVQILPNGTLGSNSNYPITRIGSTNPNPGDVGHGDFNRDGLDDLVIVNNGSSSANVYLGRPATQGSLFSVTPDLTLLLPVDVAGGPRGVVISNFNDDNGDGVVDAKDLPDIAIMNTTANSVSVFYNTGGASGSIAFASSINLTGLSTPRRIETVDFDGDGFNDLIVLNTVQIAGNHTVTLFRNNQAGGFAAGQNFVISGSPAGITNPAALAVGDFDGDLKPDIAVAGTGLVVLFNDSVPQTPAFSLAAANASTSIFGGLVATKVDANNSLDLVGVSSTGNIITLLNLTTPGDSTTDGRFVQNANYAPGVGAGSVIKANDLDKDGRTELLVPGIGSSNTIAVLATTSKYGVVVSASASNAAITITSPGHGLSNGDEVTISGVPGNLNANGTFTVSSVTTDTFQIAATSLTASTGPGFWARSGIVTGATNTINNPIVVTATGHGLTNGTLVTIANVQGNTNANGTWVIRVIDANSFELVGSVPNATYTTGGTWVVAGSVGTQTVIDAPAGPRGVDVLDANGDGFNDIVSTNFTDDNFSIFAGAGDRTILSPTPYQLTMPNTGAVAYGDLNNDGFKDIVVVSKSTSAASSRVSVLLGRAGSVYDTAFDYSPVSTGNFRSLSSVALLDTDGDGKLDIVVTGTSSSGNDGIAILRNAISTPSLTTSSFTNGPAILTGANPSQVTGGDFNGDDILDLVVAHDISGGTASSSRRGVSLLIGTGAGNFASAVEIDAAKGFSASGLVAFDADNDGHTDLAVVSSETPASVLLLRNGGLTGLFYGGMYDAGISAGVAIAAADFNGDGFKDLVVASGSTGLSTGGISVLLNEGGTGFRQPIRSNVLPGTALAGLVVGDLNLDGKTDVVVSALPGNGGSTADNVFILSGKNDGKFASATPYHTGDIDPTTNLAPSYIALGDSPLKRLTTYTTGGKFAQSNLVVNGDFERINLNGQAGNLTGWKTVKLDNGAASGSVGGWGPQSGTQSPLSGVSVIAPIASFQAMLDQPDLRPTLPGQPNPNSASTYQGSHILYQDISIPLNATTLDLSLRLYIRSDAPFTDSVITPSLNYATFNKNQQVRVDVIKPGADLYTVNPSDILRSVYRTTPLDDQTQVLDLSGLSLADLGLGGSTVRLRIASANNCGKLIVGVDSVALLAGFNDTVGPTISGLQLRTPATNTGIPQTTDPTITGKVLDNGGLNNIAYVEFDPTNSGFNRANTFRTSTLDASGNFTFTFPNLRPGVYTVGVRAVDRAGNSTTNSFVFEYMGLYTNDFQAIGPAGIRLSDSTLGYSSITGRITSIEIDPTDPANNCYYVGSVSGGIWKTTNGGNSWTAQTNVIVAGGVRVVGSIGAIAASKSTPATVYAGLGVADLQPDSLAGSGILKTTNSGTTWTLVPNSNIAFANARISKIVVDPTNSNIVYVGVASGGRDGPGVYKTTNGGTSWVNILTPSVMNLSTGGTVPAGTSLASVTDIVIDPFNRNRVLIGLGNVGLTGAASTTAGMWLTTNAVATTPSWSQVVGGVGTVPNSTLPSGVTVGTIKIGIGNGKSGDEATVYAMIGTPPGNNVAPNVNLGGYNGLYKTSNNLNNFTRVSLRQDTDPTAARNFQDINLGVETSYAASLGVDPTNRNVVYVGGSRKLNLSNPLTHALIRVDTSNMNDASTATNNGNDRDKGANGGNEGVYWYDLEQQSSTSAGAARMLPPTITALRFDGQGRLLIGTDGGIWSGTAQGFGYDFSSGGNGVIRSSSGNIAGMKLSAINGNLQITAVTSSASDPTSPGRLYATSLASGQSATNGPLGFISQDLARSANGTFNAGLIRAASPIPGVPNDTPTTLYRVWKYDNSGSLLPEFSIDNGETWTQVTNFLQGGDVASYFPAFALNPIKVQSGGQYFDEILYGTNRVYQTRTSGFAWDVKSPILSATGRITALGIAPSSTTGYYYAGTDEGQIFVNSTGGSGASDWVLKTNGLPTGLPVSGLAVSRTNPSTAYVTFGGSDTTTARVWVTTNGGTTWTNASFNLPREKVNSIVFDNRANFGTGSGKMYIATNSGVYVRILSTSTFARVGTLPNGPVVDLSLDETQNVLSASVQGRGVFQLAVGAISPISNQVISEDTSTGPLKFTLNTLGLTGLTFGVSATSSNQTVVRNTGLVLGGSGASRTITVNPVANASGSTTITLRATDGTRVFFSSFQVTVNAVNDTPTISSLPNQVLPVNSIPTSLSFTVGDVESGASGTTLQVSAFSDNPTLIANADIILGGTGANRTIQFTPAVNTTGTARITLMVRDPQRGVGKTVFDVLIANNATLPYSDGFSRGD
ncbi:MAG: hypothetical protein EBV06_11605, partial [Planctomycetia bacterium]|nr:hypothetical protein [Planctomycetia bacterium]